MKKALSLLITVLLLLSALLLTLFSDQAQKAAYDALLLCQKAIVPALFPYMIISSMLVSGGGIALGRFVPAARLFSLPDKASGPIILGCLCGFPVGAKIACDMYGRGLLTKPDAQALIGVCSNTGPAFLISVVGATFFQSKHFGLYLYLFQLLSSLISGLLINRVLLPNKGKREKESNYAFKIPSLYAALFDSLKGILSVCGFCLFFSVITSFVYSLLKSLSPVLATAVCALLEFCCGCRLSASLGGPCGYFICGCCIGFSGLCVLLQIGAFCSPLSLSLKRTVVLKALQGLLCGLFCLLYYYVFCPSPPAALASSAGFPTVGCGHVALICFSLLIACFANFFINRYKI